MLLDEILSYPEIWHQCDASRPLRVPVQQETQAIFLRRASSCQDLPSQDNQDSHWTKVAENFPKICAELKRLVHQLDGTLSRVMIVRLKPRGKVYRHIDNGAYYILRDRYHLVIKSENGSLMFAADESVIMQEGELWWFDNNQHHQAENLSNSWRIHIIFDLLPNVFAARFNALQPKNTLPDHFIDAPSVAS